VSADEARARAHALLANGRTAEPVPVAGPTFTEFEVVYRTRRRSDWRPGTWRKYEGYTRTQLLPAFRRQQLAAITRPDVARWFHRYSEKSPGGANRALSILKNMFHCAKDWGLLPDTHVNPCRGIRLNRRPPRGRLLNQAALSALGVALERHRLRHPDAVEAIRLMLLTGCRPGEIAALTWEAVKADRLVLAQTKTGPRTILIGPAARQLLSQRRRRQPLRDSPYVFPSPRNPSRFRSVSEAAWYAIRSDAGLPNDVRLHDMRHNYASYAVMGGETLLITGSLLGHRSAQTTARYAHLNDQHLLDAAGQVAQTISKWLDPARKASRIT